MSIVEKRLETIVQILLLAVIVIVPFVKVESLYFPFVSGKTYVFRALMVLAFFFWVWLMLREKSAKNKGEDFFSPFKNILTIAIVLFFLAQVAASFFGVDPVYSLFGSIERGEGTFQYGFWMLYFLMFVSVFRTERAWKTFFAVFLTIAFVLSVHSWINPDMQVQWYAVFGNPAYLAAFLLFAIGFAFLAYGKKFFSLGRLQFVHYGLFAALGVFLLTLIFTQVRGGYIALAGGVFLFCLLSIVFLRKENKKLAFFCSGILFLGVIAFATLFAVKDVSFVKETRLLYRLTEAAAFWDSDSVRERLFNWNIALKAFQEKPLFGYGPENFASAANRYYDYRIGKGEPWFDRAHNQSLDTLATTGSVGFSAYLFLLAAALFLIFKIAKKHKLLGFLAASLFLAYFLQGFFLFDLLAVYLGLFPFLAFLIYEKEKSEKGPASSASGADMAGKQTTNYKLQTTNYIVLVLVAFASAFLMYMTVFLPWAANTTALRFFYYTELGLYEKALPVLEKSFSIHSPYTFWEVRKRAGWQLEQVLEYKVTKETPPEKMAELEAIYDIMVPELERFIKARPYDPQMYYVLARTYRFAFEKLGRDDLEKAQVILKQAFQYSDTRVEYYNEYATILLLQGKAEEAEQSVKDYAGRVTFSETFPYVLVGHFYFVTGQYDKAFEQYEKARELGYQFLDVALEYNRYLFVAEKQKEYQKVIDIAKAYLEQWGPNGDTYFNIAAGYLYMGEQAQAKEFFLKAVEADKKYEEYEFKSLFLD